MRFTSVGSWLALLGVAACASPTVPDGPPSALEGRWAWDFNRNPGGSSVTIALETAGQSVTGTGLVCSVGPNCLPGTVTITGRFTPSSGSFRLTLTGLAGFKATYSGQLASHDQLQGIWTQGGQTGSFTLNRCGPASLCF